MRTKFRTHNIGELSKEMANTEVILSGWVTRIRDIGHILFFEIFDRYGIVQVVVENDLELLRLAKSLKEQDVIQLRGLVRKRPEKMINPSHPKGDIEVMAQEIRILNRSLTPPFPIEDNIKVFEETRLRWRFLDLRRPEMQRNLITRHKIMQAAREYLNILGFVEIETPYLSKSTPEGARDFIVPSRLNPGKFYALTQSPQLYKQLLMIAGFDRYYQFARCFRDEDLRADRQPEHTQIDIEMGFVDMDDVLSMAEGLFRHIMKEILDVDIPTPFRRVSFKQAMENYGSDKPDLRIPLKLVDITPLFENTEILEIKKCIERKGRVISLPLSINLTRSAIDRILEFSEKNLGIKISWFRVKEGKGEGVMGRFIKNQDKIKEFLNLKDGVVFLVWGMGYKPHESLGKLIPLIGMEFNLIREGWEFVWVTDFPLFSWDEEEKRITPTHHMFTMPYEEDILKLDEIPGVYETLKGKLIEGDDEAIQQFNDFLQGIKGKQYDLVLNGVELASGSIRIHVRDLQEKIMEIIGLDKDEREKRFGFLLKALEYGAPPHGGIAPGLDRIAMMVAGRQTIRDVIAFPKTTQGLALFEGAPSDVPKALLDELGIRLDADAEGSK